MALHKFENLNPLASLLVLVCALLTAGLSFAQQGTYVTSREVFGIHSEILVLEDGKFFFWMSSCIPSPKCIEFPITGPYQLEDGWVRFPKNKWGPLDRKIINWKGMIILVREDGLDTWPHDPGKSPYSALLPTPLNGKDLGETLKNEPAEFSKIMKLVPSVREILETQD